MSFIISPRSEAERIIFTLVAILHGFYEKQGFVVLPRQIGEVSPEVLVVLPQLDYAKIPELWEELGSKKSELPTTVGKQWIEQIMNLIPENMPQSALALELANQWEKVEKKFFVELEQYFPKIGDLFGEIEVRVTQYGTIASGSWITGEKKQKMIYYLRMDRGIEDLAAMIVNLIFEYQKGELGITWSKREALMDFVMTRPNMKKLFPRYRPVMSQLARVSCSVRKQSENYLRELGIPRITHEFELVGGKVQIKGKIVGPELTKLDKAVMKLLIEHRGELVLYDELADSVWGVGEFKTFWAINKLLERMRIKLEKIGIDGDRLKSIRGQGYLLK